MPSGASRQWVLISEIFGSDISNFDAYSSSMQSIRRRLWKLAVSARGYLESLASPRLAIVGDGVAWGTGFIQILPKLPFKLLAKELARGRPVIFIAHNDQKGLFSDLKFDRDAPLHSLLNGNESLTISGSRSGQRVFAHIGKGDAGRSAIHRHAEGLSKARASLMETTLVRKIANPVERFDRGPVSVFMQTFLGGQRVLPSDDGRFLDLLGKTKEPLLQVHEATVDHDTGPETELLARMRADLSLIEDNKVRALATAILAETESWMDARRPPSVRVHGDFTMANLLFDEFDNVTAIVDWEWTRAKGCAGFDAMHIAIAAVADHQRCDLASIACDLIAGEGSPQIIDYLDAVLPMLDMKRADIPSLAKLYWLNLLFRGGVWTMPPNSGWWHKMISPMLALRGVQ